MTVMIILKTSISHIWESVSKNEKNALRELLLPKRSQHRSGKLTEHSGTLMELKLRMWRCDELFAASDTFFKKCDQEKNLNSFLVSLIIQFSLH